MSNQLLTPTVISKRALMHLDNELLMGNMVYRDYESEFGASKVGDTVKIRRPVEVDVQDGPALNLTDIQEGSLNLTVDTHKVAGFSFPAKDLALTIDDFAERYLTDPMIKLANAVDSALYQRYKDLNNWVGQPGQVINSYADWTKVPERLDNMAVPSNKRMGIMTPTDWYAMTNSLSGLNNPALVASAVKEGNLPDLAGIGTYKSQNVINHTFGTYTAQGLVNGAGQVSTYANVKDTMIQNLITDGWTSGGTSLKRGDVFTIAGVYDVNPVTKQRLDYLKQIVVRADVSDTLGNITMSIYPALILSGPYQNVDSAPADNAALTMLGSSGGVYRQNLAFHKNCFALAMAPFEEAPSDAGVSQSTQRYKGLAATFTRWFDGTNFRMVYRLDILFGTKTLDERLGVRASGTA